MDTSSQKASKTDGSSVASSSSRNTCRGPTSVSRFESGKTLITSRVQEGARVPVNLNNAQYTAQQAVKKVHLPPRVPEIAAGIEVRNTITYHAEHLGGEQMTKVLDLQTACMHGNIDQVHGLIDAGVDRNAVAITGMSAVELAGNDRSLAVMKALFRNVDIPKDGRLELSKAIQLGQPFVVQALMELGLKEILQRPPFMFNGFIIMACSKSTPEVIRALIRHGPKANISEHEENFVKCAIWEGKQHNVDCIKALCEEERLRLTAKDSQVCGIIYREI
ncbi:hypothetical protein ASPZODRAFT_135635 [Penicilliopsis zonata CBS 506.65]|uniref:Uncharacterized protein n=1 Tax=Penicilliopsis zonata CBS 506.65 TaxID=1073090 RepID=A0A1L9SAE0_9EURO|nr:hypothetical protein ASPZODRAFT_135635 [Penicilliopsis zonata CBS 506.65]OJJ44152.1 hypothetical protein ASPZODRAFT_135635 [Penicilliopsis zonata CBS 506.65]